MRPIINYIQRKYTTPGLQFTLFCTASSVIVLLAALVAQYGFLLHPCDLCIYQRYPYLIVAVLGIYSIFRVHSEATRRGLLLVFSVLFLIGSGIATYHGGVEMGIFPGPSGCSNNSAGGESLEELRRQIMEAPLVSCDQTMAEIMGLSLAVWNALIYLFLTIVASYGYYRSRRSEYKS